MARAQSYYLRVFDIGGATYNRWQSYYFGKTVTFDSQDWQYVPFVVDGFSAGVSGDEAAITVTVPATTFAVRALEPAIYDGQLVEVKTYQFDTTRGNLLPQAGQELIASFTGQAIGGSSDLTSLTVQLGSALSPIGAQIPPRKFTTSVMGKGARL
jgi:hypothetical protein